MKVHLIKERTIRKYIERHAESGPSFEGWIRKVFAADWNLPDDMKQTFGSADLLGKSSSRVVFDVHGNNYRMICKYAFGSRNVRLYVCWLGTHAEYDQLCRNNEQFTVFNY